MRPEPGEGAPKGSVDVILTFDDGPQPDSLGTGLNNTERILDTLDDDREGPVRAIFFVQTNAPGRGSSDVGQRLIARMASDGHLVGVHTGSNREHVDHRTRVLEPAYDWNEDGVIDDRDGANGLECDLRRAVDWLRRLTGTEPRFVRPVFGATNAAVLVVYQRIGLQMLLWHIDPRDTLAARTPQAVEDSLRGQIRQQVLFGRNPIIVAFHDTIGTTGQHLGDYLVAIREAVEAEGKTCAFPRDFHELTATCGRLT